MLSFNTILAKSVRIFLAVLMTAFTPLNLILGKKTEAIADAEPDCRLSFAAISDIHLDEKASFISDGMFELGLMDMEKAVDRPDAVVLDGDMTNHGYFEQWDILAASLAKHDVSDNLVLVTGNHDT